MSLADPFPEPASTLTANRCPARSPNQKIQYRRRQQIAEFANIARLFWSDGYFRPKILFGVGVSDQAEDYAIPFPTRGERSFTTIGKVELHATLSSSCDDRTKAVCGMGSGDLVPAKPFCIYWRRSPALRGDQRPAGKSLETHPENLDKRMTVMLSPE